MLFTKKSPALPAKADALPGRSDPLPTATHHYVFERELKSSVPDGFEEIILALGCYWGAERKMWQTDGVWLTSVGNAGGHTPNPTYRETCTGQTGHTESVRVVFDPSVISLEALLSVFWESHDPTQGMRQGNDIGTQYRSAIYTTSPEQLAVARASAEAYQDALDAAGHGGRITTEIAPLTEYYYAEEEHQQYLAKNPNGYCSIGGTGVSCPIGLGVQG